MPVVQAIMASNFSTASGTSNRTPPDIAGSKAIFFDYGSQSEKLEYEPSEDWDFGTDAFTIEFYAYIFPMQAVSSPRLFSVASWPSPFALSIENGDSLYFWYGVGDGSTAGDGTIVIENYTMAQTNVWLHHAIVRNGDRVTMFRAGNVVAEETIAGKAAGDSIHNLLVGCEDFYGNQFSGYIGDFHIVKGTALYGAEQGVNFSPPTGALQPHANSVLLLRGDATDHSGKNKVPTANTVSIANGVGPYGS